MPAGILNKRRVFAIIINKEDYEDTWAILQEETPYLINLRAKVKAVAEKK
jgi:hypothetical protein